MIHSLNSLNNTYYIKCMYVSISYITFNIQNIINSNELIKMNI